MSAQFTNLPLVEVVIRVSFSEPLPFGLAFAGEVRDCLRDVYPLIDDPIQLQIPPGKANLHLPSSFGQLAGIRYLSADRNVGLQLQPDVASVQWSKGDGGESRPYPTFDVMLPATQTLLSTVMDVAGFENLPADVVSIAYTKFIVGDQATTADMLARYYGPKLCAPVLHEADLFNEANLSWRNAMGIDLRFHFRYVKASVGNETVRGYMITEGAGKLLAPEETPIDGLSTVHDSLFEFFTNSLTDLAKQEWGYSND